MFRYKSNSIFSFIILIFFLNTSNILALTQDIELNIGSGSTLNIEYVLAKGICRILSREQEVSEFMGGFNSIKCNVYITDGTVSNLKYLRSKKINYALIDLSKIPTGYDFNSLSSMIFFNGKILNWVLVTLSNANKQEVCEITEAIFKNSLELKYLHPEFKDFSHDTFIKKILPIHMGSFKYFEKKECNFKITEIGEL